MESEDRFNVSVTFRHEESSESLRTSIQNSVNKLSRYYPGIIEAKAIIDRQSTNYRVDISLQVPGVIINARCEDHELGKAIDAALDRLKTQLKKQRSKITEHKAPAVISLVEVVNPEDEEDAEETVDFI